MNKTKQHFIFFWEINALLTTAGSQATLQHGLRDSAHTHMHIQTALSCAMRRAQNDSPVYGTVAMSIWPGPR